MQLAVQSRALGFALFGLFLLLLLLSKPIHLVTADLGRHIINGQTILRDGLDSRVLSTNYYSYSYPDYPAVNHHWLFGVMAAVVFQLGGWAALSGLNVGLVMVSVVIMSVWAWRRLPAADQIFVAVAIWLAAPLIAIRDEVRPESVSLMLISLTWVVSSQIWELIRLGRKIRKQQLIAWLGVLIVLQLFWVNSHIFFPMGLLSWWLAALMANHRPRQWRMTLGVSALIVAAWFVNPQGWSGVSAPFTILHNYGYPIVENLALWQLWRRVPIGITWYFSALVLPLGGLFIWWGWQSWRQQKISNFWLATWGLSAVFAASLMFRLFSFAGLILIAVLPLTLSALQHSRHNWRTIWEHPASILTASLGSLLVMILIFKTQVFWPRQVGWGLEREAMSASQFISTSHLPAPVFNNYDSGGYLIYAFAQDGTQSRRVFTDNRPKEYPFAFWTTYRQSLLSEPAWQQLLNQYQFQSIVFHRHDMMDGAQAFLAARAHDEAWVPVYVDKWWLMLVRNTPANQFLINRYQLDRSWFQLK